MKIRKRLYSLILLMGMVALGFGAMAQEPLVPGSQDMSAEEATEIAWADMQINSGLTAEEMMDFSCRTQVLEPPFGSERYWTIVFASERTGSEYWVQVNSRTGGVFNTDHFGFAEEYRRSLERAELQAIADKAQIEMENEMGPYAFWSYQDKAAFYGKYQTGNWRHLPGSDDMSEEEAIQIVRNEIKRTLLADDAYIDSFRLDTSFSNEWYWGESPLPTWIIAYRSSKPAPDGAYPLRHSAVVISKTGETLLIVYANGQGEMVLSGDYQDTMYYNPDGGIYFHHDAECSIVDAAFRPLQAYLRGDVIHNDSLLSLMPCKRCVYHNDGDWGTDWIRG